MPSLQPSTPEIKRREALTIKEKENIVRYREWKWSWAQIGEVMGRNECVARNWMTRTLAPAPLHAPKPKGRPRITSARLDRRIQGLVEKDRRISVRQIREKLGEIADEHSRETTRRRVIEAGYAARVPRPLPHVSEVNKAKRMAFATLHLLKDPEYWDRVLWTDESMIRMSHRYGKMHVWRRPGEEYSYECAKPTSKSFSAGIMVWSCISTRGVGVLVAMEGTINAAKYLEVIRDHVTNEGIKLCGPDFIMQQDNAAIHKARIITAEFARMNRDVMEWPPQSPDLNPIENAWTNLKEAVAKTRPQSIRHLKEVIHECWNAIEPDYCRTLVRSMPKRVQNVFESNGGHSTY
jgi:hypothetical protein